MSGAVRPTGKGKPLDLKANDGGSIELLSVASSALTPYPLSAVNPDSLSFP